MKDVVIVSAVRTPIGSFGGILKDVSAVDLGALVIKSALEVKTFSLVRWGKNLQNENESVII